MIQNIINNKVYIGKCSNPIERWKAHVYLALNEHLPKRFYIHKAIHKYGLDNFNFIVFQIFGIESEVNQAEKYWIKYYNSRNREYGYNLTDGGEGSSGYVWSDELKRWASESRKGIKYSLESVAKRSGEKSGKAILNNAAVLEIRNKYKSGEFSQRRLAKLYNISRSNVYKIVNGETWTTIYI